MAELAPPYLNEKEVKKYEKEVFYAEKNELKAKKNYEFRQEYTKLCREKLEKAKKKHKEEN